MDIHYSDFLLPEQAQDDGLHNQPQEFDWQTPTLHSIMDHDHHTSMHNDHW